MCLLGASHVMCQHTGLLQQHAGWAGSQSLIDMPWHGVTKPAPVHSVLILHGCCAHWLKYSTVQ